MYESISKKNELENEMTLDMSYFWYSDVYTQYSPRGNCKSDQDNFNAFINRLLLSRHYE